MFKVVPHVHVIYLCILYTGFLSDILPASEACGGGVGGGGLTPNVFSVF